MSAPGEHSHIVQDTLGSRLPVERLRVDVGARSDRGRVREANEDAYVVLRLGRFLERIASNVPESDVPPRSEDAGYLMLVADGLGGHAAGEIASHLALASMLQRVLLSPRWAIKLDDPESREIEIRALLVRARSYIAGAHQAVREQAAVDARLAGMGTTLTGGYLVRRQQKAVELAALTPAPVTVKEPEQLGPQQVIQMMSVDPLEVEVGYGLIPIVDESSGGGLLRRITMIRRQVALDLGLVLPTVRVRDNLQHAPNAYVVDRIASAIDRYITAFHLFDSLRLLGQTRETGDGL